METIVEQNIVDFLIKSGIKDYISINKLQSAGSHRVYYRVKVKDGSTFIVAYSENVSETNTFLYFSEVFKNLDLPTPVIFNVDNSLKLYLMEDVGCDSLLDVISGKDISQFQVSNLYKSALEYLIKFQLETPKKLDFSKCYSKSKFDAELVNFDLNYFKYYFLKPFIDTFNEGVLEKDFKVFINYIQSIPSHFFMYRDFQARNIQVKENKLYFIDYQGGMEGPLQYDLASLLYQAKANLSSELREELLNFYIDEISKKVEINRELFKEQFNVILLIRILQTLGAYGYRGLFERKQHFITSIAPALTNLNDIFSKVCKHIELPYLDELIKKLMKSEKLNTLNQTPKLTLTINSFSYKRGIPVDNSGNGGGFVFDCRAITNPGKIEELKRFSGKDVQVQQFLEKQEEMQTFLQSIFSIVDGSVSKYIARGFTSLMVNFGCTGGQHRSVYAAERLYKHLSQKFDITINLNHLEKNNWGNN